MRQRILTYEQEARLFGALWSDLHPVVEFALASGLRLENVIKLQWEQVDWTGERIEFRIKSKDPDRAYHYLPITKRFRTILEGEQGRHPIYVFTFVCRRNRHIRNKLVKGERYPFSLGGWRPEWNKALKAAGLWGFRFHDLRHTAATRTLDRTNNLKLVQELLGHAEITTTERYAKLAVRKLREGMEETDSAHYRHSPNGQAKKPEANGHGEPNT